MDEEILLYRSLITNFSFSNAQINQTAAMINSMNPCCAPIPAYIKRQSSQFNNLTNCYCLSEYEIPPDPGGLKPEPVEKSQSLFDRIFHAKNTD